MPWNISVRPVTNITFPNGYLSNGDGTYTSTPGFFLYNGTPAANNLVVSDATAAGSDNFGNNYLAGRTGYHHNIVNGNYYVAVNINAISTDASAIAFYTATTEAGPWTKQTVFSFGSVLGLTNFLMFGINAQATYIGGLNTSNDIIYPPSFDTTGATDGATISVLLGLGYNVQLLNGTYYTNSPIEIPEGGILRGVGKGGLGIFLQTTIRATAAMSAMIASTGWLESANTAAQRTITISNLKLYANNQATYGIVSQNYDSLFSDLEIQATTSDCLRLDAFGADGTTQLTTTGVNNRIRDCTFQNMGIGGRGFATNDRAAGVTGVFTDGFLENCIFAGSGTQSSPEMVRIERCIGWHISGNHLYGLTQNGFHLDFLQNTRVLGNYIEQWGTTGTAGSYSGLYASSADDGEGSVISGNVFDYNHSPGNAATNIRGIQLDCLPNSTAHVAITGNMMYCFPPPANFNTAYGEYLNNQTNTCTIVDATTGNLIFGTWTAQIQQVPNGGVITVSAGV